MGISATMEIGKNGLSIYRVATEVTSENIANVNTPGYSRQRVILETAPPTTANGFPMGTGVRIASVERYYDGMLQKQLANAQTTLGFDTKKSTVLQQIEPTFNDITNDGLGTAITDYFGAWQDLTLNPAGTAERQAVITRANTLADNFHSVSKTLSDSITLQNDSLVPLTSDINATLESIAQLNGQIKITELVSGNANETRDRRDQLVRDLASKIGITFTENSDGTTDIKLADGAAPALVTGSTAGSFSLVANAGKYDVYVTPPAGVAALVAPVSGELGAVINLRDTAIPAYMTKIDTLAKSVVDTVNAVHSTGFNLAGATGQDFFAPQATVNGAAAAFSLAAGLTTATIAASGSLAALTGDNSNALAIAKLVNDPTTTSGATYSSYYTSVVSEVGLNVKSAKNNVAQDEAFTRQLDSLRESNSGVSLDEELTNLVKYQRSYQASAKLINTATEMMDIVIGMVR